MRPAALWDPTALRFPQMYSRSILAALYPCGVARTRKTGVSIGVVGAVVLAFVSGYSFGSKPGNNLAIRVGAEAPVIRPPATDTTAGAYTCWARKGIIVAGRPVYTPRGTRHCPSYRRP